jgi:ABC-2 type transport system ATP-binding protein
LSKGFKRRVAVAQAILHDPDVLILDEPTDGLDPNQKHEVRQLIREMSENKVIVISTHLLEEVGAVCSRAIIIDKGRIVTENSVAELSAGCSEVILRLARPAPALLAALSELDGVSTLSELGDGELRLGISKDVREQIAQIAVEGGLLELRSQHALEKVFLDLTRGDT